MIEMASSHDKNHNFMAVWVPTARQEIILLPVTF